MKRRRKVYHRKVRSSPIRHRRTRTSFSKSSTIQMALAAGIYGALRQKLSNLLTPLTSKVPLGTIADEVTLATIGYFAYKKTKGISKDIAKSAFIIESARIGEAVADGTAFKGIPAVTSNNKQLF